MSLIEKIDNVIMHPLTVGSVLVGALASMVQIPVISALVSTAWHQAGTLFAAVSLSATQGWLPAGTGQAAMLVTGALFLGRLVDKLWDGVERRLEK